MPKQITLELEDYRDFPHVDLRSEDHFKVHKVVNSIEWENGQFLSKDQVTEILSRPETKVVVIKRK